MLPDILATGDDDLLNIMNDKLPNLKCVGGEADQVEIPDGDTFVKKNCESKISSICGKDL